MLVGFNLACGSPLQIINTYGQLNSDFTIGKFVKSQAVNTQKSLKALSVLDCTGARDNKFINALLGTSFKGVNGNDNCSFIHLMSGVLHAVFLLLS